MSNVVAQLQGRKRVLLLGEHYTEQPLSKDHREDILRWIHDLDFAIAAVQSAVTPITEPKQLRAQDSRSQPGRLPIFAQPDREDCE